MKLTRFNVNILNLHSLSLNSEFMVYIKPNYPKTDKKIPPQIKVNVNTGLFKKKAKINKSFLERDLSSKLNKLIIKYFTCEPKIFDSIDFYIIMIKYSKYTNSECLSCIFWAIRELTTKTSKILVYKNFFSMSKINDRSEIISFDSDILKFNWFISCIMDLLSRNIFLIISRGLLSLNFLLLYAFYFGNFRWILNFKKKLSYN